jgi:Zn-dependent protease/predicted transcriptional regulator
MQYSLQLGKVFNIKVQVHWTFILIILWIIYINLKSGANFVQIIWAIAFILCLFICVILHELGHALAAKKYNIKTKDITLLPIGGVARLESMPENPRQELVVAFAGPFVNIMIILVLMPFVWYQQPPDMEKLAFTDQNNFLFKLMIVNLWLAVFNLIPAFPMDGGRVLRALLSFLMPRIKATNIAALIGQALSIGFVVAGLMFNPFLIFIGFFIFIGAQSEAEMTRAKFAIHGFTVSDIIMKDFPMLAKENTIRDAIENILNSQHKNFLIMDNDAPIGTLNREDIIKALSKGLADNPVVDVMNPELKKLLTTTSLEEAFQKLQNHTALVPVYDINGKLAGTLDLENIMEFIMIKTIQQQPKSNV